MKTLLFRDLHVGRSPVRPLLQIDSKDHGVEIRSGLHLIVAPNGMGKSTFLQTIAGVLPALRGDIDFCEDARRVLLRPEEHVSYVSEYLIFPKFIYPFEWIEFFSGRRWDSRSEGGMVQQLWPWVQRLGLEEKMHFYLGRMSQGERRKTTWLAAHAAAKPVVALDEPLDGLDLLAIDAVRAMLIDWKRSGRIVLVVAHQVGELMDLANEVWLIRDQKLLSWGQAFSSQVPLRTADWRSTVLDFYLQRNSRGN